MRALVYDDQAEMLAWALRRTAGALFRDDAQAIGLARDGELACVVVYDTFGPRDCEVHIVTDGSKRWATRQFLRHCCVYPFITCELKRVTARIAATNAPALTIAAGMGFVREGVMRAAARDGGDLIVLGLLRRECKWLPALVGAIRFA